MQPPAVVVFDLGKVLVDFDYGMSSEKFARRSRASASQIRELIDHSPLLYRYETGGMTNQEFYQAVVAETGFDGSFEEFRQIFADIFAEIKPMTALHAALRAHRVPCYIFSNTNDIAISFIRERFPFFANFDGYVYSHEERAKKPEAKIYEVVERVTGQRGEAIVYLDDRADNIAGGVARGWRTILHETPERTIPLLRAMGLPVTS